MPDRVFSLTCPGCQNKITVDPAAKPETPAAAPPPASSPPAAPPCEPLKPLYRMPARARRKTFTVLMADNVRTLDGQVAFYLQVNCLINAQETGGMAVALRRALLFHLKHYRHWWDTQEAS